MKLAPLTTSRLILSPLDARHRLQLWQIARERRIADTTISVPHPLTEEGAKAWIDGALRESLAGRAAHFVIALLTDPERLIGYIAIKAIDHEHGEGELSFWLEEGSSGQGYASEAADALTSFGFDILNLNRICAYHMARNPASGRLLQKLRFRQEGVLRQRVRKWGTYEDVLLWARLKAD